MQRQIAILLLLAGVARAQTGKPGDIPAFIARMTGHAMRFEGHLPDFICTRTTIESTGTGDKWKQQHIIAELTEFTQNNVNARYKLIKLDGRAPSPKQSGFSGHDASLVGLALVPDWVFDPKSGARFEWRDRENLNGQPVDVFTYTTKPWVSMSPLGAKEYMVAFRGLVFASADNADVLRLEVHQDGPTDFPMHDDTIVIDYSWVEISGQRLLLPARSTMQAKFEGDKTYIRREATFTDFRKYSADSKIDFGDPVRWSNCRTIVSIMHTSGT